MLIQVLVRIRYSGLKEYNHRDALAAAASRGHDDIAQAILRTLGVFNISCDRRVNALGAAAKGGHFVTFKLLFETLEKGENFEETLFLALIGRNRQIIDLVLDSGISVDCHGKDGRTPLVEAVSLGEEDLVKILLERGADPNTPSYEWVNPLSACASMGHVKIVKFYFHMVQSLMLWPRLCTEVLAHQTKKASWRCWGYY